MCMSATATNNLLWVCRCIDFLHQFFARVLWHANTENIHYINIKRKLLPAAGTCDSGATERHASLFPKLDRVSRVLQVASNLPVRAAPPIPRALLDPGRARDGFARLPEQCGKTFQLSYVSYMQYSSIYSLGCAQSSMTNYLNHQQYGCVRRGQIFGPLQRRVEIAFLTVDGGVSQGGVNESVNDDERR